MLVGFAITIVQLLPQRSVQSLHLACGDQRLDGHASTRSGKAGFEEGQCGYQALLVNHKEEAVRWLRDATTLEPKSPELWIDLAAYRGLGNNSAATAEYHEARKLKPDDPAYAVLIDQQSTRNPEPAGVGSGNQTLSHYFRDKESYRKQFTK